MKKNFGIFSFRVFENNWPIGLAVLVSKSQFFFSVFTHKTTADFFQEFSALPADMRSLVSGPCGWVVFRVLHHLPLCCWCLWQLTWWVSLVCCMVGPGQGMVDSKPVELMYKKAWTIMVPWSLELVLHPRGWILNRWTWWISWLNLLVSNILVFLIHLYSTERTLFKVSVVNITLFKESLFNLSVVRKVPLCFNFTLTAESIVYLKKKLETSISPQ